MPSVRAFTLDDAFATCSSALGNVLTAAVLEARGSRLLYSGVMGAMAVDVKMNISSVESCAEAASFLAAF